MDQLKTSLRTLAQENCDNYIIARAIYITNICTLI